MTSPMTMSDVFELGFQMMKEVGASKEELARFCMEEHNRAVDMRYSWLPFGKTLAETQYLKKEELLK